MEGCCERRAKIWLCSVFSIFVFVGVCVCQSEDGKSSSQNVFSQRFKLEGKVVVPGASEEWMSSVRVLVDGGQYLGLLKWVTLLDELFVCFRG